MSPRARVVALLVVGLALASLLGLAGYLVTRDTIALPATAIPAGNELAPPRSTTTTTASTTTRGTTTDDDVDRDAEEDNSRPGSDSSGRGRGRGRGRGGDD